VQAEDPPEVFVAGQPDVQPSMKKLILVCNLREKGIK